MTKLFMLTQGSYSDYHVCGIYSTQELAGRASVLFGDDNNDVKEIELDEIPEAPPNLIRFQVEMGRNGEAPWLRRVAAVTGHGAPYFYERSFSPNKNLQVAVVCVWAEDPTHAIKIVNEKRIQMVASGEWDAGVEAISRK